MFLTSPIDVTHDHAPVDVTHDQRGAYAALAGSFTGVGFCATVACVASPALVVIALTGAAGVSAAAFTAATYATASTDDGNQRFDARHR